MGCAAVLYATEGAKVTMRLHLVFALFLIVLSTLGAFPFGAVGTAWGIAAAFWIVAPWWFVSAPQARARPALRLPVEPHRRPTRPRPARRPLTPVPGRRLRSLLQAGVGAGRAATQRPPDRDQEAFSGVGVNRSDGDARRPPPPGPARRAAGPPRGRRGRDVAGAPTATLSAGTSMVTTALAPTIGAVAHA